jgi:hypothetical protein
VRWLVILVMIEVVLRYYGLGYSAEVLAPANGPMEEFGQHGNAGYPVRHALTLSKTIHGAMAHIEAMEVDSEMSEDS